MDALSPDTVSNELFIAFYASWKYGHVSMNAIACAQPCAEQMRSASQLEYQIIIWNPVEVYLHAVNAETSSSS